MSDNLLFGTEDQGDESSSFNAADFHIQSLINQINTAALVKIVKAPYDKDGNTIAPGSAVKIGYIDCQPLVNQLDGRGKPTPHGVIYRLSYHRYQGGTGAIILDPVVGDIGKLVVASRDTSSVRATDKQANPGSRRKFDLADGSFMGITQAAAPEQYITFVTTGIIWRDKSNNKITTNEDGIKIEDKNGNTIIMGADGVMINGARITKEGDVITKLNHDLDTHVHTDVESGGSNTGPPA